MGIKVHKESIFLDTTKKVELLDITPQVRVVIAHSGVRQGTCAIMSNHTTMAIRINEHEPNLVMDTEEFLSNGALVPEDKMMRHDCMENRPDCPATEPHNGPAHLKTMLLGTSENALVEDGQLKLGRWQAIQVLELDGPRKQREVTVMVQGIDEKTAFEEYFDSKRELVEAAINDFLDKSWEAYILRAQRYLMKGGKRIRGVTLLLSYEAFGGKRLTEAMDAAVAVEVLHSMSLHLDDPADGDLTRRGRPAAWVAMKLREMVTVVEATIPHAIYTLRRYGMRTMDEALATWKDLAQGQVADLFVSNWRGSKKLYPETIHKKTGALFALTTVLGARIAKATPEQILLARHYGRSLGFLFQVADDIADLKAGKSVSDSFREWAGPNPEGRLQEAMEEVIKLAREFPDSPVKMHLEVMPKYAVAKLMAEVENAGNKESYGKRTDSPGQG